MTERKRLCRVLAITGTVLALGLLYAGVVQRLGFGIPCVYKTFLGLDCPSCGISRMFLAMLRLDFAAAFAFNPVIFCLLPLWCAIGIRLAVLYVKRGHARLEKWALVGIVLSMAILLAYGVLRNIV